MNLNYMFFTCCYSGNQTKFVSWPECIMNIEGACLFFSSVYNLTHNIKSLTVWESLQCLLLMVVCKKFIPKPPLMKIIGAQLSIYPSPHTHTHLMDLNFPTSDHWTHFLDCIVWKIIQFNDVFVKYWLSIDALFRSLLRKLFCNKTTVIMNFKVNMFCLALEIVILLTEEVAFLKG
jgi:hypothetical protein